MAGWSIRKKTGVLVLADGTVIEGYGLGDEGEAVAEVCFNTAMTGYQEILTDPSYARQIICFTFPHIGNVGVNDEDIETVNMNKPSAVCGCVFKADMTAPANYRASEHLDRWLKARGIIGLSGVDTRALTIYIRDNGAPRGVIAHNPDGVFDLDDLKAKAAHWSGLENLDLVPDVTTDQSFTWTETVWDRSEGFKNINGDGKHIVAVDFGVKRNILRLLVDQGFKVSVVKADTPADIILGMEPDGVFLSNGPGDPAATGEYAVPMIQALLESGLPIFGICLGHQMLALALGGKTVKMHQGHHGANHPVIDYTTDKVEITSMNHGFAVDGESLPEGVEETHRSLFDGSNCGLRVTGKPVFSVQYHPEASPGPEDSHYLFARFANLVNTFQAA